MAWAARLQRLDPQAGAAAGACAVALAGTLFFWQTAPPLAEYKGRCRLTDLAVGGLGGATAVGGGAAGGTR